MPVLTDPFTADLAALGVHEELLPPAAIRSLDAQGFAVVPGLLDAATLAALRERLDALRDAEGRDAAREHHQEDGCTRLANLVNKDALFDRVWLHPLILAGMARLFRRPFKLSSLNAREALRGGGHQPLHQDWKLARSGDPPPVLVANALWAIDDMDAGNGAPRLVPGTHRRRELPSALLADPAAPHPDEVVASLKAGSVLLIDAHLWHGGTANRDGRRRRILHSYFTAAEEPQQQDQRRWLRPETRERLSPAALRLLLGEEI